MQQFQFSLGTNFNFKKLFLGVSFLTTAFPAMMSDDPDFSFEALQAGDENALNLRKKILRAPRYQKLMKRFLPYFNEIGVLEV